MIRGVALSLTFLLLVASGPAKAEHVCRITGQVVRPCAGDLGAATASLQRATCCDVRVTGTADAGVHHPERLDPAPVAILVTATLQPLLLGSQPSRDLPRERSAGPPLYLRARTLLIRSSPLESPFPATEARGRTHVKRLLAALIALAAAPAQGAQPDAPQLATPPQLAALIDECLAARPEIAAAKAAVRARSEVIPRVGALPDPVLQLGIQNDGFASIEIGTESTSFVSIGLAQTIPWPGKLRLAEEMAAAAKDRAATRVDRVRLATEGEVRRNYVALLLARDRLGLLDRLETLWQQSAGIARTRYETGEGSQSDLLRAQLELSRLRQRRTLLEAEARTLVQAINRLRSRPLDEDFEPAVHLADLAAPALAPAEAAVERSPEIGAARLTTIEAEKGAGLARRSRFPDVTVSAALMPRGALPPMWALGVGVPLPVFAASKQSRAEAEGLADAEAGRFAENELSQQLALASARRVTDLGAARAIVQLYRGGLLVQSQATAQSTLSSYQVGRATFLAVLEANAGQVNDEESYLLALAQMQRLGIDALENLP